MIPGTTHFPADRDKDFSRIFGGVAWPALQPGFVAVVGEHGREQVGGEPKLIVLDEASDGRLWHVVEQAAALRLYYRPERFLGDGRHVAAMQFVEEFRKSAFFLEHSLLCEMDGPFAYALPILDRLIATGRLEIPKNSTLNGELMTPPPNEDVGKFRLSDYPAIAALSFAVLEIERTRPVPGSVRQAEARRPGRILE